MTRKVNFEGQQRVEVPDMEALQEFSTQDARRIMRRLIMGTDRNGGKILRGFEVEAIGGEPSRVIIRMDNGGGDLSAAVAGINQGVTDPDWGQLIGDRDGFGNLEGSSQNILDFAGQPAAIYEVKIRATFTDGTNDNRAFWSPSTDEEFIQETPTRSLPQWEVAFQDHADSEWVLLAEVDWNGATLTINDKREFAHEGIPYDTATLTERWSHAAQDDAGSDTNGVGDFDRTHDRADAQVEALWDVVRALQRQVQDLKGARDNDLRWDWYSRPLAAPGFLAVDPTTKQTRNLRTLEAVTFTVSDGIADMGDFTGPNAVNDCFAFIQDNAADLPHQIDIFIKTRDGGVNQWSWLSPIIITGKNIRLSAAANRNTTNLYTPEVMVGVDQARIIGTGMTPTIGPMLTINQGSIHMENISMAFPVTPSTGVIHCSIDSTFSCNNCVLQGHNSYAAANSPVIRVSSQKLKIENSFIRGVAYIGGKTEFEYSEGNPVPAAFVFNKWVPGRVVNTVFEGLVRTRWDDPNDLETAHTFWHAKHLFFEKCWFQWDAEQSGTGPTTAEGQIDATGMSYSGFDSCEFVYSGDQNCLTFVARDVQTVNASCFENYVRNCRFKLEFDATHDGFIGGAGGASGDDGTGWAIFAAEGPNGADEGSVDRLRIEGCSFEAGSGNLTNVGAPFNSTLRSPADAGYIRIRNLGTPFGGGSCWILNNEFNSWREPNTGQTSEIQRLVSLESDRTAYSNIYPDAATIFEGNRFHAFRDDDYESTLGEFHVLYCEDMTHLMVHNNYFILKTSAQDLQAANTMITFLNCESLQFVDNYCEGGRHNSSPTTMHTMVGIQGTVKNQRIDGNTFADFGGAAVRIDTPADVDVLSFSHNSGLMAGMSATDFNGGLLRATGATLNHVSLIGNHWDYAGATADAFNLPSSVTNGVMSGNVFPNGEIRVLTAGGSPFANLRGYAVTPDFNYVSAYV